ncbi:MAG: 30S ribosome-binding factor RbfA [Alphaproteobacteria bacterium]
MKHNKQKQGPTQRQLRVGEQLRHIIAETMQRGHFSHVALLDAKQVTVSEVRVSPDLRNATAYVMPLGGYNIDEILPALNEEHQVFQKEINRQSNMKFTPRVSFKRDKTFDEVQKIDDLLNSIHYSDQESE